MYEALAQIDPSQVRDLHGAEAAASAGRHIEPAVSQLPL
jgi:hypothetical protein